MFLRARALVPKLDAKAFPNFRRLAIWLFTRRLAVVGGGQHRLRITELLLVLQYKVFSDDELLRVFCAGRYTVCTVLVLTFFGQIYGDAVAHFDEVPAAVERNARLDLDAQTTLLTLDFEAADDPRAKQVSIDALQCFAVILLLGAQMLLSQQHAVVEPRSGSGIV
jgi:hypothetical protein